VSTLAFILGVFVITSSVNIMNEMDYSAAGIPRVVRTALGAEKSARDGQLCVVYFLSQFSVKNMRHQVRDCA
jgi:hypothetical protein